MIHELDTWERGVAHALGFTIAVNLLCKLFGMDLPWWFRDGKKAVVDRAAKKVAGTAGDDALNDDDDLDP